MESISNQLKSPIGEMTTSIRDPFDRDAHGLSPATATPIVELEYGDLYHLHAGPVAKQFGDNTVKMLAYNGSIPGPTLWVPQGAEVVVHFSFLVKG
ncbi:MAG: hypothetical protein QME21_04240 [Anaerolineales bacterium]|nr:hypothetical protein [Anaerolineales bacterium]